MAERFGTILDSDLNLFRMMDDVDEVADYLKQCEAGRTWQKVRGFTPIARERQVTAEGTLYGVTPTTAKSGNAEKNAENNPQM
jgi:hypothetical protein